LRFLRSAPLRIVIGAVALLGAVFVRELLLGLFRLATGVRHPPRLWLAPGTDAAGVSDIGYAWFGAALMMALGLGAYRLLVKWLEHRRPREVARPFAMESALGGLIGLALVFAVAGALALSGQFRVTGGNGWQVALVPLAAAATAAVMEELLVRGLLLRILEERLGSWLALATTALLFGAIHASNSGATAWSTVAVALSAGVVLGAAFILTRRLWLAVGLHFGVNTAQGALLGIPVSGQSTRGWLRSELVGHPFWTGGPFGLEASVVTLLFAVLIGGTFLVLAWRRGQLRPPNFRGALAGPASS
jgi:membrane protease YdiL (CAAX protease family)